MSEGGDSNGDNSNNAVGRAPNWTDPKNSVQIASVTNFTFTSITKQSLILTCQPHSIALTESIIKL